MADQHPAPPSRSLSPLAGAAALLGTAIGWQGARLARRILTRLRDDRRHAGRLAGSWTRLRIGDRVVRMHGLAAGKVDASGLPFVLVHGYGVSAVYHVPLAERLAAAGAAVELPELPGHGESPPAEQALTIAELADVLGRWLETRRAGPWIVVGHSMGSQIAAELALHRPELVGGLVLIGPTVDAEARSVARQVARAARVAPVEAAALDARAALDYVEAGPRIIAGEMRHMLAHHLESVLPRLHVPTLVVRGEHDHIAPQRWTERIARLADAPPPAVIPGEGHAAQYGAPDAVAAHLLAFTARIAACEGRRSGVRSVASPAALGR